MLICFSARIKDHPSSEDSTSHREGTPFLPDKPPDDGSYNRSGLERRPLSRSPSLASQYSSSLHCKLTKELTIEDKWTVYARRHQVMWQPDSTAPRDCPLCDRWFFWMWRRLHHCRKCGRIVCAACSKARLPVPHEAPLEDQPPKFVEKLPEAAYVRYCDACSGAIRHVRSKPSIESHLKQSFSQGGETSPRIVPRKGVHADILTASGDKRFHQSRKHSTLSTSHRARNGTPPLLLTDDEDAKSAMSAEISVEVRNSLNGDSSPLDEGRSRANSKSSQSSVSLQLSHSFGVTGFLSGVRVARSRQDGTSKSLDLTLYTGGGIQQKNVKHRRRRRKRSRYSISIYKGSPILHSQGQPPMAIKTPLPPHDTLPSELSSLASSPSHSPTQEMSPIRKSVHLPRKHSSKHSFTSTSILAEPFSLSQSDNYSEHVMSKRDVPSRKTSSSTLGVSQVVSAKRRRRRKEKPKDSIRVNASTTPSTEAEKRKKVHRSSLTAQLAEKSSKTHAATKDLENGSEEKTPRGSAKKREDPTKLNVSGGSTENGVDSDERTRSDGQSPEGLVDDDADADADTGGIHMPPVLLVRRRQSSGTGATNGGGLMSLKEALDDLPLAPTGVQSEVLWDSDHENVLSHDFVVFGGDFVQLLLADNRTWESGWKVKGSVTLRAKHADQMDAERAESGVYICLVNGHDKVKKEYVRIEDVQERLRPDYNVFKGDPVQVQRAPEVWESGWRVSAITAMRMRVVYERPPSGTNDDTSQRNSEQKKKRRFYALEVRLDDAPYCVRYDRTLTSHHDGAAKAQPKPNNDKMPTTPPVRPRSIPRAHPRSSRGRGVEDTEEITHLVRVDVDIRESFLEELTSKLPPECQSNISSRKASAIVEQKMQDSRETLGMAGGLSDWEVVPDINVDAAVIGEIGNGESPGYQSSSFIENVRQKVLVTFSVSDDTDDDTVGSHAISSPVSAYAGTNHAMSARRVSQANLSPKHRPRGGGNSPTLTATSSHSASERSPRASSLSSFSYEQPNPAAPLQAHGSPPGAYSHKRHSAPASGGAPQRSPRPPVHRANSSLKPQTMKRLPLASAGGTRQTTTSKQASGITGGETGGHKTCAIPGCQFPTFHDEFGGQVLVTCGWLHQRQFLANKEKELESELRQRRTAEGPCIDYSSPLTVSPEHSIVGRSHMYSHHAQAQSPPGKQISSGERKAPDPSKTTEVFPAPTFASHSRARSHANDASPTSTRWSRPTRARSRGSAPSPSTVQPPSLATSQHSISSSEAVHIKPGPPLLRARSSSPRTSRLSVHSPSPVPSSLNEPSQSKPKKVPVDNEAHRARVLSEIVSSERIYLAGLHTLLETFLVPLTGVVADKNLVATASHLSSLTKFHDQFLSYLETSDSVPLVFLKYSDFLKYYSPYLNTYTETLKAIDSLSKNKKFEKFLKKSTKNSGGKGILMHLILPVQRIPRYQLLLEELAHFTPEFHSEYAVLVTALSKIKDIAEHVNESKRHMEHMSTMYAIHNRMPGSLIQPNRHLLRESECRQKLPQIFGSSEKNRMLFLFSDILLWTNRSLDFRGKIGILSSGVCNYHSPTSGALIGLQMHNSELAEPLTFLFDLEKDSAAWVEEIERARDALVNGTPLDHDWTSHPQDWSS